MTLHHPGKLLKIFVGEAYMAHGMPIHEHLVWEARKQNMAGVTVIRGEKGMGHDGVIQRKENARDHDLPVVIEVIDTQEKIEKFVPVVTAALGNHGFVVMMDAVVLHQDVSVAFGHADDVKSYD